MPVWHGGNMHVLRVRTMGKCLRHRFDSVCSVQVPDAFYLAYLPIMKVAGLERMRSLDPVAYNFSRKTMTWDETFAALRRDASF